jgi:hypothetical protein
MGPSSQVVAPTSTTRWGCRIATGTDSLTGDPRSHWPPPWLAALQADEPALELVAEAELSRGKSANQPTRQMSPMASAVTITGSLRRKRARASGAVESPYRA